LQNASVVINCDLPWNPAKLEQRIARAWRKHQTRPVTVINLVSEKTIEQRMLETLSNKQALADGVLDLQGNLSQIKFGSGRQAFLARLQQLVTAPSEIKTPAGDIKSQLPADRQRGFALAAQQRVNGAFLRCEERYPNDGAHSVLYIVVERDAPQWREKLGALHLEYFGPGQSDPLAPVRLEVIDRATDESLQRLLDLGLISRATRATRPLWPETASETKLQPLSDTEREKAGAFRQQAARKLKIARLLGEGDLGEEARSALLEAMLPLGRALAIESRLPEPAELNEVFLPPLAQSWREALTPLRLFTSETTAPWKPVLDCLSSVSGGAH